MSTDTPTDTLASDPDQELVLLATRAPGSTVYHRPSAASSAQPACNGTIYDGQLVPRWYAEDELGRRPHADCFSTQEDDPE